VRTWNARSGAGLQIMLGHEQGVSDIAWSADSRFIASVSDDKAIKLWDVVNGDEVLTLEGHSSYVFCVNFNSQSNLLVTGSFDESVKLWDVRTGSCLKTIPAHSDPVTAVDFNRDGTCVMSGSHDGLIRLWDTGTGECLKTIFAEGNPPVSYVKYSPNGRYILVGTLDDTVRLWNVSTPSRCLRTYRGHANRRFCIFSSFSTTHTRGPFLVSGSEDKCVYLWGLQDRSFSQKLEGHTDTVLSVSCHPTERRIASGGSGLDKTVRLWESKATAAT
jgi:COMPASS component SWD3